MVFGKVNYHLHKVILNLKKIVAIKLDIQNDGLNWHFRTQILDFTITFISSRFKKRIWVSFFMLSPSMKFQNHILKLLQTDGHTFSMSKFAKAKNSKKKKIFFIFSQSSLLIILY